MVPFHKLKLQGGGGGGSSVALVGGRGGGFSPTVPPTDNGVVFVTYSIDPIPSLPSTSPSPKILTLQLAINGPNRVALNRRGQQIHYSIGLANNSVNDPAGSNFALLLLLASNVDNNF